MTVRQFAKRQLWGFLLSCGLMAVVMTGLVFWAGTGSAAIPSSPTSDPAPSRAERLAESHGCWTGAAPADMQHHTPGHVVVTKRNGMTVYAGPRLVAKALDQQFAGKPAGLEIHAFCR